MNLRRWLTVSAMLLTLAVPATAQITPPNVLVAGNTIRAAELNTNFATLGDKALNRITGGSIEGNITLLDNVTIDSVDISDYLLSTGEVRAQTSGSVTAPSYSRSGDTSTGVYFPASGSLGFSLSGTERMKLDGSGLTVWGVNIISASGQIPGISSTYFSSLDGASLTNLNASALASGTVPDGRLSSNVVLKNAANILSYAGAALTITPGSAPAADTKILNITDSGASSKFSVDAEGDVIGTSVSVTNAVLSTLKVTGGTPAVGKVLTSDSSGNASWQDAGVASGAVPSGAIMMFDAACPVGYTRFATLDDRFPRGGPTYSAAGGGSDTHTHSVDPVAFSSASGGAHTHTVDPVSTATSTVADHTHAVSGATDQTNTNHTHTFTTTTNGSHTHGFTTGGPNGWATANDYGVGADFNYASNNHTHSGSTDSGGSHNHTGTTDYTSQWHGHNFSVTSGLGGSHAHTVDIAPTTSSSDGAHTHTIDVPSTLTAAGSNVPAYVTMVFCRKD